MSVAPAWLKAFVSRKKPKIDDKTSDAAGQPHENVAVEQLNMESKLPAQEVRMAVQQAVQLITHQQAGRGAGSCDIVAHASAGGVSGNGGIGSVGNKHKMVVKLNRDIVATAKAGEYLQLCALVLTRWSDFDAVNAATAYTQMISLPPVNAETAYTQMVLLRERARGNHIHTGSHAWESSMSILEDAILKQHVSALGAREFSNILHALAKNRTRQEFAGAFLCISCVFFCVLSRMLTMLTIRSLQTV